jgi:hypothetical protein
MFVTVKSNDRHVFVPWDLQFLDNQETSERCRERESQYWRTRAEGSAKVPTFATDTAARLKAALQNQEKNRAVVRRAKIGRLA